MSVQQSVRSIPALKKNKLKTWKSWWAFVKDTFDEIVRWYEKFSKEIKKLNAIK